MDSDALLKKQPSLFAKIVMVLLALSPILQNYGWGKFDFSFIIMSLLAVCHLLVHGIRKTKVPRTFFLYFGWWYISHLLSSSSIGEFLPLGLIKIAITYIMFVDLFDLDYFMSKYKKIALVVIIYFYIQEVGRIFVGIHLPSVFSFLPIAIMDNAQEYIQATLEWERSSSFLQEPAVFAQYLLPLLCYELFDEEREKKWVFIIFLAITLLCSRAGNAMVGLMALTICYGFYLLWYQKGIKKVGYIIFGGVFVLGLLSVFFKTEDGQEVLERAMTMDSESTLDKGYASSTFMRVYQGFYIFSEFSDIYKVIGNDHDSYIQQQAFSSPVISLLYKKQEFSTYFNTFQHVLIYTGYIGVFFIFLFFRDIWKGNSYCGKSLLIVLLALSFISSNFFSQIMALYLLPAMGMKQRKS